MEVYGMVVEERGMGVCVWQIKVVQCPTLYL